MPPVGAAPLTPAASFVTGITSTPEQRSTEQLAARILGSSDDALRERLDAYAAELTDLVEQKNAALQESL